MIESEREPKDHQMTRIGNKCRNDEAEFYEIRAREDQSIRGTKETKDMHRCNREFEIAKLKILGALVKEN